MVRIVSNKLICILLMVIIIINTIMPSVCYGDFESAQGLALEYYRLKYSQDYNMESDEETGEEQKRYNKGILAEVTQYTNLKVEDLPDNQGLKEVFDNSTSILYDFGNMLKELEEVGYDYTLLSGEALNLFNIVTNNEAINGYMFCSDMMNEILGNYGPNLFSHLVFLRMMVDEGNDIFQNDRFTINDDVTFETTIEYLSSMGNSFVDVHNDYVKEYYDIEDTQNIDDNGMIKTDNAPLKNDDKEQTEGKLEQNRDELWDGIRDENDGQGGIGELILGFLDYSIGLLIYIPKIIILSLPLLIQSILSLFVSGGQEEWAWVSIEQILFNRLTITSINFFSSETVSGQMLGDNIVSEIRGFIGNWYYAFRNLVIVLYLCILIYIGIRMAISSVADEKAKYKAMLKNWVVGLGLTVILHYIIIIIIQANNLLVSTISPREVNDNALMKDLFDQIFWLSFTTSFGSLILYAILVILTFIFFIMYLRRMITVSFLVIVAPLITLTYPIDKAGDGKSQILNNWMREFISDVLIQFFHCVIYVVFVQTSMEVLAASNGSLNFAAITLAIVCTCSIFFAEKILKKLFGLDRGGTTFLQNVAMGALIGKIYNNVKAIKGSKNDKQEIDVPDVMPDGEDTLDAASQLNNSMLNAKLEHQFGEDKEQDKETSQGNNTSPKKKGVIQKGVIAYGKGLDALAQYTVPGYRAIKKSIKTKYNLKTKDVQKLFEIALERYTQNDENMTKEQFLLRMQALKNTDIENTTNYSDFNMKIWMNKLVDSYSNAGKINPQVLLDKSIDKFANKNFSK